MSEGRINHIKLAARAQMSACRLQSAANWIYISIFHMKTPEITSRVEAEFWYTNRVLRSSK